MNTQLTSALSFAKLNCKVFPLKFNTKSGQLLRSWKEEASSDPCQIEKWFSHTNFNVGVRTGSGLMVIDVDVKHSAQGIDLIRKHMPNFPKTFIVQTPSGGYHIYYYVDREIYNRVRLYPEIDIRGENGYVVAPGSVIDDKSYRVISEHDIAFANDYVYKFIKGEKNQSPTSTCAGNVGEGMRNDYLFRLGCYLQKKGFCDEAIKASIHIENEMRCNPNLERKEVDQIIKSIMKYPKGVGFDPLIKNKG